MEEMKPIHQKPLDRSLAVAISDATFAWQYIGPPKNDKKKK